MNQKRELFSEDDATIRQAFALVSAHRPQINIAAAALALANKRRLAALQRTSALQRINRLWRVTVWAAMSVITCIIAFAIFWGYQTTSHSASTTSNSATYTATSNSNTSFTTVALEWILLLAGLAIVWLIVTSVVRAVSTDTYEGLLA
jgi:hypothetical protein